MKMPSTLSIEIPREVFHDVRMTPHELKRELAIHLYLYGQGRLSFGKSREMAGSRIVLISEYFQKTDW